jgi:hypothetical protein
MDATIQSNPHRKTTNQISEGRDRLNALGKKRIRIVEELRALGFDVSAAAVSFWCSGLNRPDAFWRRVLFVAYGIPEAAWLTGHERAVLARVEAAVAALKAQRAERAPVGRRPRASSSSHTTSVNA